MEGIADAAVDHFRNCNQLLQRYICKVCVGCNILDFRPTEADNRVPRSYLQHLSDRVDGVQPYLVPGSHWTMLFDENVEVVGSVLHTQLERLCAELNSAQSHHHQGSPSVADSQAKAGYFFGGALGQPIASSLLGASVIQNHFEKPHERARSLSQERVRSMDSLAFRGGRSNSAQYQYQSPA